MPLDKYHPRPTVGQHWLRADGSTNGVTIVAVDDDPIDPWVTYQYDDLGPLRPFTITAPLVSEKNLLAFHCRFFYDPDKTWPA